MVLLVRNIKIDKTTICCSSQSFYPCLWLAFDLFFYGKFPLKSENSTKGSQIKQVLELKLSKIDSKSFWVILGLV